MKCALHMERDAIGTCCCCGRFVCQECEAALGGKVYCNRCVETRLKTGSWPGDSGPVVSYASGRGPNTLVPPEIKGWSWGGFLLTWVWGIGNNVWIALISLLSFIPWIGWVIGLTMRIILGVRGNEWAWQNKKWDSIEHFKKTQRTWMWWGVAAIIASVVFIFALVVLLFSLFMIGQATGLDKNWGWQNPW